MDNTQRLALEREFDEKRDALSTMMERLPDMEKAYAKLELALRARKVYEAQDALKEEDEEVRRMDAHCQQAKAAHEAATASGDKARIVAAAKAHEDTLEAFRLAERHRQDASRRYQAELLRQGFASEAAYRDAFLAKPAQLKLEEEVNPFRERYAQLLGRLEEIERQLSEDA